MKLVKDMGALTLTSYLKKSWIGATVVVSKNEVIGGIWIASFLCMLYDMTEVASVNIKLSEYVILYANYSLNFPTNTEEMHYLSFILLQKS